MKKLSKQRKIILATFFGILALLCFHPLGRMIVKILLPMGLGIIDLIGSIFFFGFLFVVIDPYGLFTRLAARLKFKKQSENKSLKKGKEVPIKESPVAKTFIFELMLRDNGDKYVHYFMKIINAATKRDKIRLLERFINYYGNLTLKLLDSQEELSKNLVSQEIKETALNNDQALNDVQSICNNFYAKLLDDDLMDVNADIQVLGVISNTDNLL